MAYKKTYKRKTNYKTKNVATATKALKKVNLLEKKLKPEVKFVDFKTSPEDLGSLGKVYNLTKLIATGITSGTKIGRKIRLLRLTGTMQMELDNDVGDTDGAFRFMLVKGNNEDDKTVVVSKVAAATNDIPLLNDTDQWPLISRKVDDDSKRTRFIYDKTYTLDVGSKRMITKKINFKLGWDVQYMIADISLIQDGGLYVCGCMNSSDVMSVVYNFRLWYTDM